jgi:hypothetical protein
VSTPETAQRVRVLRIRMPRDRSFVYARLGPRFALDVRLMRRRYYSPKRVEYMSLRTPAPRPQACTRCGDCYHPAFGPNTDGDPCDWCQDCGCPSADHEPRFRPGTPTPTPEQDTSAAAVASEEASS